jgi:hypothetical protein
LAMISIKKLKNLITILHCHIIDWFCHILQHEAFDPNPTLPAGRYSSSNGPKIDKMRLTRPRLIKIPVTYRYVRWTLSTSVYDIFNPLPHLLCQIFHI